MQVTGRQLAVMDVDINCLLTALLKDGNLAFTGKRTNGKLLGRGSEGWTDEGGTSKDDRNLEWLNSTEACQMFRRWGGS